jgi:hypothetical protein
VLVKIKLLQKRIVRVIMNSNGKDSCRDLFKKLCILLLHSQYIFSILLFVVKNRGLFKTNSDVHKFNTWTNYDLHLPTAKLTVYQKEVYYSGIKIYNHLSLHLKQLSYAIKKFKSALKRFLLTNSFYTLDEYYSWK